MAKRTNKPKKATKIQMDARIHEVTKQLIQGVPEFKIVDTITTKYNLDSRTARTYIKRAYSKIKPVMDDNLEEIRNLTIAQIENKINSLPAKYIKTPSGLNAYINGQKLLINLKNVEPAKKIKLEGDQDNPLTIKWEEVKTYKKEDDTE